MRKCKIGIIGFGTVGSGIYKILSSEVDSHPILKEIEIAKIAVKDLNKKRDIDVAYAIIELFKRKEEIENFNKKALYILIREMTNVNTIHITSVVNTFKSHYKKIVDNHYKTGNNKKIVDSISNKFF